MSNQSMLDENWEVLLSLFPKNWKELAKETGAVTRKLRNFPSEDAVMRTLLIHLAQGYSLRETIVKAKMAGIADVSDVALLKRLRLSESWLKSLCEQLLKERGIEYLEANSDIKMRLVDATIVKEPGKTGGQWRIHYSLRLPDLRCDYFKLTPTKGKKTGESYTQFPIQPGDCIIGDRGYSTANGIEHIFKAGGYSLVRVNCTALPFYTKKGTKISLLPKVQKLNEASQIIDMPVCVKAQDDSLIEGRLCIIRKSEQAIADAIKKLKANAIKKQESLKPETIEYAKYIIVYTTLPKDKFSTSSILNWYRLRWQIELIFKRLKSLAGLGHLPKHDESSSRAWLYGKLFVGLLVEKLITLASAISPWGYCLGPENGKKSVA